MDIDKDYKIGYWEIYNVKAKMIEKSNSRKQASIAMWVAEGLISILILTGCYVSIRSNELVSILALSASAGVLFTSVAGTAMYFLFNQKRTEKEENENKTYK